MTRDSVLAALRAEAGFISGERISKALGLSRAAVNAAIMSLRADGYTIESATNRGYRLTVSPDALSSGELLCALGEKRSRSVLCLDSVGSTNDRLRALAEDGAEDGAVVTANAQTNGRGRYGRSFESPADKGIYLSMLLRPEGRLSDLSGLTGSAAVATADAIEAVCGFRPGIKWVNDLVADGRKLCGILTELSVEAESGAVRYVILGVGVNVNETAEDFAPSLSGIAASVYTVTGRLTRRAELAAAIIRKLDALRGAWPRQQDEYLIAYRRGCVTVGRPVRVITPAGERNGFAEALDDDFALVVRYDDGSRETVKSGEVSIRGQDAYI